jgi:hypothetical protein
MTASRLQCVMVWILVGLLTGCTSLRPLHEPSAPDKLRPHLHQGDRVEVATQDGWRIKFRVTEIGETALAGTAAKGKGVEVPYEQIKQLKVRRFSLWKTALMSIGLLEVAMIGLVAVSPPTFLP